ncbi:FeoC like transcriptional regulator [Thiothrix caldifontis]|jgi:Transcriptional regulators of sugar metabolism|uniref:FeoC like transcriptional regulator n=1 Tax=Thiothrix caldifontis TaxID=525918 RepID=A0A1H3YLS2_9GAMM|nr:FeoC-like transcriptional regulator [Thiothrix caldifontis]SEA12520.1 FeoC like transcriptional regulator [Thiothrix caldifontis]
MLLGEIRDYLQQRGSASLQDVATHFDIAPDTAQFALGYWQKKGKVLEQAAGCASGGCDGNNCGSSGGGRVYTWAKREIPLRWVSRPA